MRILKGIGRNWRLMHVMVVVMLISRFGMCADSRSERYVASIRRFADRVLADGRDRYGEQQTPLFVDGLQVQTLEPACWKWRGETWVLSNFASQQPLLRTLDGLAALTGEEKYRHAAEEATRYALRHLRTPNGLLYWGGHLAWDLEKDAPVGQHADVHELKGHQAYYRLMWRVDRKHARKLMEMVWAAHVLDWSLLELHKATNDDRFMNVACRVADNILKSQTPTGLFPRPGRQYARSGDDVPLAILHLAAAMQGKQTLIPAAVFDRRFFHCEYQGQLETHQKKRADSRTYDHLVYYGES